MTRTLRALAVALVLALAGGCAPAFDPPPRPAVVGHMDIAKKRQYIAGAKTSLKNFRTAARDLQSRNRPLAVEELAAEVRHFVDLQVVPIVADFEAENNLETRLEIAKLQLLCGQVWVELGEVREARRLLKEMDRRYGNNPSLMTSALDRNDIGFATLEDGLRMLKERIAQEVPAAHPRPNPMTAPAI